MRIFVTGSIAFDYIMVFPGRFRDHILPEKMHVLSVSFLVDSLTRLRGGTGANISFNLGLLGERPVLVGSVGEDFSEYRAWLERHGVDCSAVQVVNGDHTASCFINTDLQDNQITAFYPGAMAKASSISITRGGGLRQRPGPDRAQRPGRDESLCGRVHRGGHSLSLRPVDAAPAAGESRPRGGLPWRTDPGRERLRVRHDGR